jgi:hypothetical protein
MKKTSPLIILAGICLAITLSSLPALSQEPEVKPALLEQPMPDFTLPAFQGGSVSLSSLKGKNVLIVFPRGFAAEGRWCTICNYKYAELVDFEKTEQLRKKFNLEIVYVFPYGKQTVQQWLDDLPAQLDKIKAWKNPSEADKQDDKVRARMEMARKGFPKDLSAEKGKVPVPFPILMDEDRKVRFRRRQAGDSPVQVYRPEHLGQAELGIHGESPGAHHREIARPARPEATGLTWPRSGPDRCNFGSARRCR